MPGPQHAGCFVQRVAAIAPDLVVGVDDELVVRVVDRLDGLPLAIEMAAAQLATMSLAELDAELAAEFGQSIRTIRAPQRNAPTRHQTLAAVSRMARIASRQKTSAQLSPGSRSLRDRSPPRTPLVCSARPMSPAR